VVRARVRASGRIAQRDPAVGETNASDLRRPQKVLRGDSERGARSDRAAARRRRGAGARSYRRCTAPRPADPRGGLVRDVVRLSDFEALAREVMDPGAFDYYFGGAWDEITLADNVAAFGRFRLRPRVV